MATGTGAGARDGPGLRRADPCRATHRRDAEAGRDPLQGDAGARPAPARRGDGRARPRRSPAGGDGVPALRHLWLPPRPHRRRAPRSGTGGRARGLRSLHGTPARGRAPGLGGLGRCGERCGLVRDPRAGGRHRVPRLRHGERGGRGPGAGRERRRGGARRGRRYRGAGGQPDALLRRGGRASGRHRQRRLGRRCARPRDRHAARGGGPSRPPRHP